MPDLASMGTPLVFKMAEGIPQAPPMPQESKSPIGVRTYLRALEGMQKEAVVCSTTASGKQIWRMASDEGPYLNGTDLAPFPLAFFSAGMQFSLLSEIIRAARARGILLKGLRLLQDNFYTMDGSALQGTMIGGAKPVEVKIEIEADAAADTVAQLVRLAEKNSPAHALMRDVLSNTFALTFNEEALSLPDLTPSPAPLTDDLAGIFAAALPDNSATFRDEIITKVATAEKKSGVEGGAGSSLQANQKRTLHIHGESRMIDGFLLETTIQLFRPIGSSFKFICDETQDAGGGESAPPPLAYLAAGVGFCYMTQLGRYAHITKQNLHSYQIIQDAIFENGKMNPVDTLVVLDADETDDVARKTVTMGERTCFLHAAMRDSYPSEIALAVNGEEILIPESV